MTLCTNKDTLACLEKRYTSIHFPFLVYPIFICDICGEYYTVGWGLNYLYAFLQQNYVSIWTGTFGH